MRTRTHPIILLATLLAMLLVPATAHAAESAMPTLQAKAYGMDWVPFIDPADLPPVEQRRVVCLVDSGVAVTPDLPPDRPEGPVTRGRALTVGQDSITPTRRISMAPRWRRSLVRNHITDGAPSGRGQRFAFIRSG